MSAGSLVRLTRYTDRAEGRFDPTYAAFMGLRNQPAEQVPAQRTPRKQCTDEPERRTTTLDPRTPWKSLVGWFLASFGLGADISLSYGRPDEDWKPTVTSVTVADGSWAEVTLTDDHGVHHVVEVGPRRVWRTIENAHALWKSLDCPGWGRFGLTVTEDRQHVWLDTPTSPHIWPLPPARHSSSRR